MLTKVEIFKKLFPLTNLTQNQFSEKAGLTYSEFKKYLSEGYITRPMAKCLGELLEMDLSYLVDTKFKNKKKRN